MSPSRRPRPYMTLRAAIGTPLLLTCEHATQALPPGVRARPPGEREILASHWGWDIGAWQLTRELATGLQAGAVGFRWSRLWIDVNRRADDPTLIRRAAGGLELSWNRRLPAREVERRVLEAHAPYHEEVDRQILRRVVRGARPLLLAVHSFTPQHDGRRRDFDAGVLYEHHGPLAYRLGRALRQSGLEVRYNQPYSGMAGMMYSADRHGRHHGLPCLELEVNQALFRDRGISRKLARAVVRSVGSLLDQDSPAVS